MGWWIPLVEAGASLLGGALANEGADKQADAVADANGRALALQQEALDYTKSLNADDEYYGRQANALRGMNYGILPFDESPDQQLTSQFSAYGVEDPIAAAYLSQRGPEFAMQMQADAQRFGRDINDLVNDHYRLYGQNEGLMSPQAAMESYTPPQATGTPSVASSGLSPQDALYDVFQQSGEYRSMIPVQEADRERLIGQRGAMGNALSGAMFEDLSENMKQYENQAFNQFMGGLGGLSGDGATASAQLGSAQQGFANNSGNLLLGGANSRASSYGAQSGNTANAIGSALGGISDKDWAQLGNTVGGWFS